MSYQREYERRLRVGFVGVGSHAYRNLLPALTYLPVELKAICDVDRARAETTAEQYGVGRVFTDAEEMFQQGELEAVFISVSPRLHPELTRRALAAGLHVWMEKPPSIRAAQVEEMIRQRGDRVCLVGFKKAFMPSVDKVAEIFENDECGSLKSISAVYPLRLPTEGKRLLEEGHYTNNLCHPLSLMMRIGGEVSAVTTHRARLGGGCIVFEFRSGAIGNLHMADGAARGQPIEHYCFYGDGAHLEIRNSLSVAFHRGILFKYSETTNYAPPGLDHGTVVWKPQNNLATLENKALFTQGIWGEMRYFCGCILEQRAPKVGSLEFALELMKAHEAALLSEGERIELDTSAFVFIQ